MFFLGLLPLTALGLIFAAIDLRRNNSNVLSDWRDSLFVAMVLVCLWTAAVTEILGVFHLLVFWPIFIAWMILSLLALVFVIRVGRKIHLPRFPSGTWTQHLACALIATIAMLVLVTALIAPPNNIDSLDYHLPRIVAWMQQGSLADFPTNYCMQLAMPGFMEYLGLNSMILGDKSGWAVNIFGTLSLLMLGLAGSSIAKRLGGNRESQFLAMLFIISIPMAFGMGSTFKPELLEAFWIELLAYWSLAILIDRRCGIGQLALIAAASGLAVLTHGTGYVFGVPLAVMISIGLWRAVRWKALYSVLSIGAVVLLINAGYYARNISEFGRPLGPSPQRHISLQVVNTQLTSKIVLENLLRDSASMVAGPSHLINQAIGHIIENIASALGLNLQDPRATQPIPGIASPYDGVAYFPNNEYRTSWPMQMFLIGLLPLLIFIDKNKLRTRRCGLFALLPIGSLMVVAAVLRWQQTINHLLVPIPSLFMPVAAVMISSLSFRWFRPLAALGAGIALLPFAFLYPRTLVGQSAIEWHSRTDLLVRQHSVNARTLKKVVAFISRFGGRPLVIGLSGRTDLPPYAIEAALISAIRPCPKFIYFNASIRVTGVHPPAPTLVVANANTQTDTLVRRSTHELYVKIATLGSLSIFRPMPAATR